MLPLILRRARRRRRKENFCGLPPSLSSSPPVPLAQTCKTGDSKETLQHILLRPSLFRSPFKRLRGRRNRCIDSQHRRLTPPAPPRHPGGEDGGTPISFSSSYRSPSSCLPPFSSSYPSPQRVSEFLLRPHIVPDFRVSSPHTRNSSSFLWSGVSPFSRDKSAEARRTTGRGGGLVSRVPFPSHHQLSALDGLAQRSSSLGSPCSLSFSLSSTFASPFLLLPPSDLIGRPALFSTHRDSSATAETSASSSSREARQSTSPVAASTSTRKPQEPRPRFQLFRRPLDLFGADSKKASLPDSSRKESLPRSEAKSSASMSKERKEEEKENAEGVGLRRSSEEDERDEARSGAAAVRQAVDGGEREDREKEKEEEEESQILRDDSRHWLAAEASRRRRGRGEKEIRTCGPRMAGKRADEAEAQPAVTLLLAHASALDHPTSPVSKPFVVFIRVLLSNLFSLHAAPPPTGDSSHRLDKHATASPSSESPSPSNPVLPGEKHRSQAEGRREASTDSSSFSVSPAPLLHPSLAPPRKRLPFEFLTVDTSTEPQLAAFLRASSLPSLILFYHRKEHAVLSPTSTTFSDANLLKFFREAWCLSTPSSSPLTPRRPVAIPVKPDEAVHAVKTAREVALSKVSMLQGVPRRVDGVKERKTGEGEGRRRLSAENFSGVSKESSAEAIVDAWTESRSGESLPGSWLEQSRRAMKTCNIAELERLGEKMERSEGEDSLTKGHALFAKLYLLLYKNEGSRHVDRASLIGVLEEIVGGRIMIASSSPRPCEENLPHPEKEEDAGLSPASSLEETTKVPPALPSSRPLSRSLFSPHSSSPSTSTSYRHTFSQMYAPRGLMNELETVPAYGRLVARASLTLFDSQEISDEEVEILLGKLENALDLEEKVKILGELPPRAKAALTLEEPARPLDEAVHFAHVSTQNEREALTYAVRAYRLDCQGATEEVLKDAPSKLPGGWREDESPVYQPVPDQSRSGASTTSSVVMIRGGGIGGNGPREDLFDQMACLRAGWPARALVMAMYMALGARHPAVERSRAELEVWLGTDSFVPVVFPRTKAVVGGKPIMMRGKSGKWHWLGPYWKPPWAPPNKTRWQTGPEEWSWTDPTR